METLINGEIMRTKNKIVTLMKSRILDRENIKRKIEPTKASVGSHLDLPTDLRNSKLILNKRNGYYNFLQITITAWLHPVKEYATRESKYSKT